METEDFERLKAFCEKEGFTIESYSGGKTAIIGLKDKWDGVEFVDRLTNDWPICKINSIEKDRVFYYDSEGKLCSWGKGALRPSTEQAYVDQLKKTAFEKLGEIKVGDRFNRSWAYYSWTNPTIIDNTNRGFVYSKNYDKLLFNGSVIYEKGKWAERVKERVEVRLTGHPTWTTNDAFGYNFCFHFKVKNGGENLETHKAGKFLASQLEKYLNGEIE